MKKHLICIAICILNGSFSQASIYRFAAEKGQVTFTAKGRPALISIRGEGAGVEGMLTENKEIISGEVSFQLKSLHTGIELRDEHMKNKFLEIEKYPIAIFKINDMKIPEQANKPFKFTGTMTLHGVQQPIEGEASLRTAESTNRLTAEFKIQLTKFQIIIPSFQGITVAENVQVNVDLPLVKAE